jgi:hypothetical protein
LMSWQEANNSPTRLEHTKYPLHILPSRLLLFSKPTLGFFYRFADCLHKCALGRIYTIYEIVWFVIGVTIDLIGDIWSMAFCKPIEYQRSLKHVDIIVRFRPWQRNSVRSRDLVAQPPQVWSRAPFRMATVLPLTCKYMVLSFLVHALNASKHSRKASWFIDWQ